MRKLFLTAFENLQAWCKFSSNPTEICTLLYRKNYKKNLVLSSILINFLFIKMRLNYVAKLNRVKLKKILLTWNIFII